jgi:anti-anti-sigma regulatory factor
MSRGAARRHSFGAPSAEVEQVEVARDAGVPDDTTIVFPARTTSQDVAGLTAAVHVRLAAGERRIVCDLSAVTDPCVGTVDVLARLALTARRAGADLELVDVSGAVRALLDLAGLDQRLRPLPRSARGVER